MLNGKNVELNGIWRVLYSLSDELVYRWNNLLLPHELMNLPSQNFEKLKFLISHWCPDLKVLIFDNGRRQSFARTTIKTATSRSWDSSYGPKDDSFLLRPDRVGKTEEKVNHEVKETLWFSNFYVDLWLRVSDIQHTIAQANTKTPQQGLFQTTFHKNTGTTITWVNT